MLEIFSTLEIHSLFFKIGFRKGNYGPMGGVKRITLPSSKETESSIPDCDEESALAAVESMKPPERFLTKKPYKESAYEIYQDIGSGIGNHRIAGRRCGCIHPRND